jgi:F0F1-type ATP synthase membrane subunit b/b'
MVSRRISLVIVLIFLFATIIIAKSNYDPADPSTWSPHEIKEWLAENRINYKGIPERQELVDTVKKNWYEVKDRAKTSNEAVESFVTKYIDLIKDKSYDTTEYTGEKYNELTQEVADQIEYVRQSTGLTEEQVQSTFSDITKKLKGTKSEGNKNLQRALDQVKKSYSSAPAKREVLIQETANRVQDDLLKSKEVSQETIEWFKQEVNDLNEQAGFSKARTETQVTLILHGVQEQLTKRKVATEEQINSTYDRLNSAVKQYYQSISSTLERLGNDLTKKIGGTSDYIVEELRSQFSTVNDYRLLTQEKIQNAVDAIGQKFSDGKNLTVEQFQYIKQTINKYFGFVKYYYDRSTGQVRQTAFETKEAQQERLNNAIESVRSYLNSARDDTNRKLSKVLNDAEVSIADSQQLTAAQTKILSETIQEKFGGLKETRDLSEEKVNSFTDALSARWAALRDYASDTYDTTTQKVEEGYNVAQNKVSTGAENIADRAGDAYKSVKDQFSHKKDEL